MKIIENRVFEDERALYESDGVKLFGCAFEGAADGESALKESKNIITENCLFDLRYPFWHDENVKIINCKMTEKCRAPLWYSKNITMVDTRLSGTKALRECTGVLLDGCNIESSELCWDCSQMELTCCLIKGEYFMSRSKDLRLKNVSLEGKYSFQYIENAVIDNCVLNTKDAFWHAKNVTVKNCTVKGEYLGWYSENLIFENCTITGTQPLCYCRGLKLINCEMHSCDLAFEKSEVEAEIITPVISIKNVLKGKITVPCVDKIICDKEEYKGIVATKQDC